MPPKRTNHQFERRKKEQARQERAAARRARKQSRVPGDRQDPDLAGITPGPQAREAVSDAEVARAVERAMNPGGQHAKDPDRSRHAGGTRLFVGNLDFATEEDELRDHFAEGGFVVVDVNLMRDRHTGQPRGFAFVELAEATQAARAIETLHGSLFRGRALRINAAEQRS